MVHNTVQLIFGQGLSQEAAQRLWSKWRSVVWQLLDEFNNDVFNGRGVLRENAYGETLYLLLETKNGCLYVFPLPGDELAFRVYRRKIEKEYLSLKGKIGSEDGDNLVGGIHLKIGRLEKEQAFPKYYFRECLATVVWETYHDYWINILF